MPSISAGTKFRKLYASSVTNKFPLYISDINQQIFEKTGGSVDVFSLAGQLRIEYDLLDY